MFAYRRGNKKGSTALSVRCCLSLFSSDKSLTGRIAKKCLKPPENSDGFEDHNDYLSRLKISYMTVTDTTLPFMFVRSHFPPTFAAISRSYVLPGVSFGDVYEVVVAGIDCVWMFHLPA